jgi:hypothetical protein
MEVTKQDIVGELGHDQYTVLGPDSPGLPILQQRLIQAQAMGQNPKGLTVNDFVWTVIGLNPDNYGTGFDPRLLIYVVFKNRKTKKTAIHADYYLASWGTAFALAQLG